MVGVSKTKGGIDGVLLLLRLGIRGKAVIKILQLEDTLRQNFGGFLDGFIIHFHLELENGYQLPATLFSSFRTAAITITKGLLRRCCGEGRVGPSIGGSFNLPSSLPPSIDIYLTIWIQVRVMFIHKRPIRSLHQENTISTISLISREQSAYLKIHSA